MKRWFRVPRKVYEELVTIRTSSDYVLGSYSGDLIAHYESIGDLVSSRRVIPTYDVTRAGDWFYNRMCDWVATSDREKATVHDLRKTVLQVARRGEDANKKVAEDAGVSKGVMTTHYTEEGSEEYLYSSNRTYERIVAASNPKVLDTFGYEVSEIESLRALLSKAVDEQNWDTVASLVATLKTQESQKCAEKSSEEAT